MPRLTEYSLWLMEPRALQRAVRRALLPPCPTGRDLAEVRRQRLNPHERTRVHWMSDGGAFGLSATYGEYKQHAAARTRADSPAPKVGVIPIRGPIQQRVTAELLKNDGTSTEEVSAYLDAFVADPSITSIVLDVDSGGGEIGGVEELAAKIYNTRRKKKVFAIANSAAASAALWIASAAEKLYATPGALLGSVGVYMMHADESKALTEEGITVTFIHAGADKVKGNPFEPLDEATRAHWQELVDYTYGRFSKALALYRGVSEADVTGPAFGEGRVFHAAAALNVRMIDNIKSFDQLIGELTMSTPTTTTATKPPARAAVAGPTPEVLRLREDLRRRGAAVEEEPEGPQEGDKVTFKEGQEHEPFEAGTEYIVRQVSTPALGLATVDDPERIMRWATAGELEPAGGGEAPAEEAPAEEVPA